MNAGVPKSVVRHFASGTALLIGATAWSCNAPRQPATPAGQEKAQGAQEKGQGAQEARPANAQESSQERIQRLEREARALAKAGGCESSADCRAAPVGSRPCGGPRTYLVYCARTTDSVALFGKLDELARAERAHNTQQGLFSTCEFRTPPQVEASGGSCRAIP
jgi:hypothetical protein